MKQIKSKVLSLYCNFLVVGYSGFPLYERAMSFLSAALVFTPIAFVMGVMESWFTENQDFTLAVLFMIMLNMTLGGYMHFQKRDFDWFTLLYKTLIMVVVVLLTYFVLEIVISFAGTGLIVNGFRAALQIATLLYPGAKVLKHLFILSDGEHPPKWIMHRVYNFKENGDLSAFVSERPEFAPPRRGGRYRGNQFDQMQADFSDNPLQHEPSNPLMNDFSDNHLDTSNE